MLKILQAIMSGGAEHALHRLWSNQLTEAEAAAIHVRARKDPGYREELDRSLGFLAGVEALADDGEIRTIATDYRRVLRERKSKQRLALGIAAGVLVAFGAALVNFPLQPARAPDGRLMQKHATGVGEQRAIELDDGSVVTLNTNAQLLVDYGDESRRILLERGEAYFEAARDSERPFTVDLGFGSVTALGTAFNIRKHRERFQVAVIEGTVALHESAGEIPASPAPLPASGQAVVIAAPSERLLEEGWVAEFDLSRDQLTAFRPESMERYGGWRGGMLGFYQEPLNQVVQELNRYSRKKILIEDASVMELSVSMAVSIQEIDSAIKSLELVLPVEVSRHYDRIVIGASAGDRSVDQSQEVGT